MNLDKLLNNIFQMGEEISNCNVGSPIQSMTLAWDTIYIGTKTGYVVQYDIKVILISILIFSNFWKYSNLNLFYRACL